MCKTLCNLRTKIEIIKIYDIGKITHLYSLDMIFTKMFDKIRNLQKYSDIP